MTDNNSPRQVGDRGQCEAYDLIPTEDDAACVRCREPGIVILEKLHDVNRTRIRCVCWKHGYGSYIEVN